jgi:DNA-binding SARP family transcriptional activator
MRYRILGPLEIFDGTEWHGVGTATSRSVLATLLIRADHVVSVDQLIFELWGDAPPKTAPTQIHRSIMRLRRALNDPTGRVLVTVSPGYRLAIADDDIDAERFSVMAERGHAALRAGQPDRAADLLNAALDLWHGPALSDVSPSPLVTAEADRLAEQRLAAWEARVDADLDLGRHAELVGELRQHVEQHPLRERSWRQLMIALHRSGRVAEALQTFHRLRRTLVDEIGVEPCAELRQLHEELLAGEPAAGAGRVTVPRQLPAVGAFVGRVAELARLDDLLTGEAGAAVVVSAIAGAAGVGKTTLALRWAHLAAPRFPDGQLYVNLHGYDSGPPAPPATVLAQFLQALGVPPDDIPPEEDQRAALYRTLLAGKRMLVVLDNASSPDHVRPLLPGPSACATVITSRDDLRGLTATHGVHRLSLDVLNHDDAAALLTRVLGAERTRDEPDSVAELARLCGHLPLALRIAGANLAARPHQTVAGHVAELSEESPLTGLVVTGDRQAAVRAAFDHSYAALPEPAREMFRLLGLVPGPEFTPDAAAALASTTVRQASSALDQLAAAHMIESRAGNRYTFHDLVRLYARERVAAEDTAEARRLALQRLFNHYLGTADVAAVVISPQAARLPATMEPLPRPTIDPLDYDAAMAWLDLERDNLAAAIIYAAGHGFGPTAWRLAYALRAYMFTHRLGDDWLPAARAGLTAAIEDDDHLGQAAMHLSLGASHGHLGNYRPALEHFGNAAAYCRQLGWRTGESSALNGLGTAEYYLGMQDAAITHQHQALSIGREIGSLSDQARALGNLAYSLLQSGRLADSAERCRQALTIYGEFSYPRGRAMAVDNLGLALRMLGDPEAALGAFTEALDDAREVGTKHILSTTLCHIAAVHHDARRWLPAQEYAEEALLLARIGGDHDSLVETLIVLAGVLTDLGRYDEADGHYAEVMRAMAASGFVQIGIDALIGVAKLRCCQGCPEDAIASAREALTLADKHGFGVCEGRALTVLAEATALAGRPREAAEHAERARAVHARTGYRLDEERLTALESRVRPQNNRNSSLSTPRS